MILDKLENALLYSFNDKFRLAFNFLLSNDLESLPACRLHLQGDDIVVSIVDMEGKGEEPEDLEAHHEFADIHYLVSGEEKMAWKPQDDCMQQKDSYDEQKDEERFTDEPSSMLSLQEGHFVVFFPHDAHKAGLAPVGSKYRKIIIKVRDI